MHIRSNAGNGNGEHERGTGAKQNSRETGAHERQTSAPGKQLDNKHYVKLHYARRAQFVER